MLCGTIQPETPSSSPSQSQRWRESSARGATRRATLHSRGGREFAAERHKWGIGRLVPGRSCEQCTAMTTGPGPRPRLFRAQVRPKEGRTWGTRLSPAGTGAELFWLTYQMAMLRQRIASGGKMHSNAETQSPILDCYVHVGDLFSATVGSSCCRWQVDGECSACIGGHRDNRRIGCCGRCGKAVSQCGKGRRGSQRISLWPYPQPSGSRLGAPGTTGLGGNWARLVCICLRHSRQSWWHICRNHLCRSKQ